MSLLVPVFTAVQKRVVRMLSVPEMTARASGSARMAVTMKAASGSGAGLKAGFACFASDVVLYRPPLARVR